MVLKERPEAGPVQPAIVKRTPSQLQAVGFADAQLEKLVGQARGNEALSREDLLARIREEFGGEDGEKAIYFSYAGNELVGAAVFGLWRPGQAGEGGKFWRALEPDEEMLEQLLEDAVPERKEHIKAQILARAPIGRSARAFSPLALEIQRIFTLPSRNGEKIGAKLFEHAVTDLSPSIVLGLTQSPQAVVASKDILGKHGFRTFFGNTEFGPSMVSIRAFEHVSARGAYLDAKGLKFVSDREVIHLDPRRLPPKDPSLDGLSVHMKDGFSGIAAGQFLVRSYTVVKPLISIRAEVISGAL